MILLLLLLLLRLLLKLATKMGLGTTKNRAPDVSIQG